MLRSNVIRDLTVHIDEPLPLPHGYEIVCSGTGRVVGYREVNLCPRDKELPAATGVLDMDLGTDSVDIAVCDESVGATDEGACDHAVVSHELPFCSIQSGEGCSYEENPDVKGFRVEKIGFGG